jgi:hypothetical protein
MFKPVTPFFLFYFQFALVSKVSCSFINLNMYIDIFPPTYFVRVHVDKIVSENLGPSKVPLTILSYKGNIVTNQFSKSWCKFFPVGRNFIGYRTQNTVNLISLNITKCYTPGLSSTEYCFFMDFLHGKIKDGRRANSVCEVSGGRMHTLIIAELWEHDLIKQNAALFWKKVRGNMYGNFVLMFYNKTQCSVTVLCAFKLIRRKRSLYCIKIVSVSEVILTKMSGSPVSWSGAKDLMVPERSDSNLSELWEIYLKHPLDEILLIDILKRANESMTEYGSMSRISRIDHWNEYRASSESILLADQKTRFLSCFSKPIVNFEMYVKPFKAEVWLSIFVCCSFISTIISLYNMKLKLTQSFNPYLFFVSTLFEEPYSVPSVMWNNRIFKTVTITWLLTAMVFTNLYTGLMISDVTSPLQRERLVSFDQVLQTEIMYDKMSGLGTTEIMNFWLNNYTKFNKEPGVNFKLRVDRDKCTEDFDYMGYEAQYRQFESQEYFALLQKPANDCGGKDLSITTQKILLRHPWMYAEFQKLESELFSDHQFNFNKLYKKRAFSFFAPRNRHFPRDPEFQNKDEQTIKFYLPAAIEKELVACNRSIFMGEANELKYELSYLITNYPAKGFYMPDDSFENGGSSPFLWEFTKVGMSKAPVYFKLLIETGIREGITGIRMHKHYLMRRNGTKLIQEAISSESNVGMAGSIQTIFFILVFLLTIAAFIFTIEVIIRNSSFRRTCNALFSKFTNVLTKCELRPKFTFSYKLNSFLNRKLRLIKT